MQSWCSARTSGLFKVLTRTVSPRRLVSNFSEPIWCVSSTENPRAHSFSAVQLTHNLRTRRKNFYIVKGDALNTTMKLGAWGLCTRLRVRHTLGPDRDP